MGLTKRLWSLTALETETGRDRRTIEGAVAGAGRWPNQKAPRLVSDDGAGSFGMSRRQARAPRCGAAETAARASGHRERRGARGYADPAGCCALHLSLAG